MGRHFQRHRIALTACVCIALLAVAFAPRATSPDGGGLGDSSTERVASDWGDAFGSVPSETPSVPPTGSGAGSVERRASPLDMREEALSLLSSSRSAGDCVLVRAGYVDLMGRVWSCTVQGDGWVDVCVVRPDGAGDGSAVTTVRMRGDEWSPAEVLSNPGGSDDS